MFNISVTYLYWANENGSQTLYATVTWEVPLVETITFSNHPSSSPVYSEVRVAQSLVLCVVFCRSLVVLCPFSFVHCTICPPFLYATVTWEVPLVETITLSKHPSSSPVYSGVRVAQSLVLCVVLCRSLIVICPFSFGHCTIRPPFLVCGFWLSSNILMMVTLKSGIGIFFFNNVFAMRR